MNLYKVTTGFDSIMYVVAYDSKEAAELVSEYVKSFNKFTLSSIKVECIGNAEYDNWGEKSGERQYLFPSSSTFLATQSEDQSPTVAVQTSSGEVETYIYTREFSFPIPDRDESEFDFPTKDEEE